MEWKAQLQEALWTRVTPQERSYLQQAEQLILSDYKTNFNNVYLPLSRRLSLQTRESLISMDNTQDSPLIVDQWTILRLARVWMLSLIDDQPQPYKDFIDKLFDYAD